MPTFVQRSGLPSGLLAALLFLIATSLGLGLAPAVAAPGDACTTSGNQPGTLDNGDPATCQATSSPAVGAACAADSYYNGAICVADSSSCGNGAGTYSAGVCQANAGPDAPNPTSPTTPVGFGSPSGAGALPPGGSSQQPMCVNASPFIGGGAFVVSGTVLCYTGAGRSTAIYAYSDEAGGMAWNPFESSAWDSLTMKDLYASDDITARGTLSVYGGGQIISPNGYSGLQVTDDRVLVRAADADNAAEVRATPGVLTLSATNGTTTSSIEVNGDSGVAIAAQVSGGGPAVSISGTVDTLNTARTGVLVTGAGKGDAGSPTGGAPAPWADVLLASQNFGFAGGMPTGAGSGVVINDYGVMVRSANEGSTYNEFGSGAYNTAGSVLTNVIGSGGAGTVNNYLGVAGAVGTVVTNEIGTGGNGGATINRIGNLNPDSAVIATAGTSSVTVIQGALDLVTGQGDSILEAPTQNVAGGTATSMRNASGRYALVDSAGSIRMVQGTAAPEATSATYIENGYGTTNGFVATERSATMSGGETSPTSLVLNDNGAHWYNSTTGAPVVVSGVADGNGPYDAANIRQLDSGLASVAALAGLPAPQAGKNNSVGIAFGHHNSGSALAIGGQSLIGETLSLKYGASVSHSNGLVDSSASVGIGMSW